MEKEDGEDRYWDYDGDDVMQSDYTSDLTAGQATFHLPQGIRLRLSEALLQLDYGLGGSEWVTTNMKTVNQLITPRPGRRRNR